MDLTGKKFGRLIVLGRAGKTSQNEPFFMCKCECGRQKKIRAGSLLQGKTKSCGCLKTDIHKLNLSGRRFGKLTAIKIIAKDKNNQFVWECECDCGKRVSVVGGSLTTGNTRSCGCLRIDRLIKRMRKAKYALKHGHCTATYISTTYYSWSGMKSRCNNKRTPYYKNYGGRGIKICSRWLGKNGFMNFLEDMGERPEGKTLDRINNDGNYEPSNCRWATTLEQNKNKRTNYEKVA